jgi:hypothetical protein
VKDDHLDTIETERTVETEPTRRSRRDRRLGRGPRRAVATLAAAAAMIGAVGTVQKVTEQPASASYGCGGLFGWFWDTTGNCYYDEFIWYLVGGTFYVPPVDVDVPVATPTVALSNDARGALDRAEMALNKFETCRNLIAGPVINGRRKTGLEVIQAKKTDANVLKEMPGATGPFGPTQAAGTPTTDVGKGKDAVTNLYAPFYNPVYSPSIFAFPPNTPLNAEQLQTLAILHEAAHATGKLKDDSGGAPLLFNTQILISCLKIPVGAAPGAGTNFAPTGDVVQPNQGLVSNTSIFSADGRFRLTYQEDTNLVLYRNADGAPLWATGFKPGGVGVSTMGDDGNLVIYSALGDPVWATGTYGNPGSRLVLQNDGNLVIYRSDGVPIWATNTVHY